MFEEERDEQVRVALIHAREQQRPQVYCDKGWKVLAPGPQWEAALDDELLRWLKTTHGPWHWLTRLFILLLSAAGATRDSG